MIYQDFGHLLRLLIIKKAIANYRDSFYINIQYFIW